MLLFLALLGAQPLMSVLHLPQPNQSTCAEPFFVAIAGDDIRSPGIYVVCDRSDLQGLLANAQARGGPFGFPADLVSHLDLAKGPRITVQGEAGGYRFIVSKIQAHRRVTLGIQISLNQASEEELTAIPGVGLGIARAIARERVRRGRFERMDELLRVRGIGPKVYDRMKPYLML